MKLTSSLSLVAAAVAVISRTALSQESPSKTTEKDVAPATTPEIKNQITASIQVPVAANQLAAAPAAAPTMNEEATRLAEPKGTTATADHSSETTSTENGVGNRELETATSDDKKQEQGKVQASNKSSDDHEGNHNGNSSDDNEGDDDEEEAEEEEEGEEEDDDDDDGEEEEEDNDNKEEQESGSEKKGSEKSDSNTKLSKVKVSDTAAAPASSATSRLLAAKAPVYINEPHRLSLYSIPNGSHAAPSTNDAFMDTVQIPIEVSDSDSKNDHDTDEHNRVTIRISKITLPEETQYRRSSPPIQKTIEIVGAPAAASPQSPKQMEAQTPKQTLVLGNVQTQKQVEAQTPERTQFLEQPKSFDPIQMQLQQTIFVESQPDARSDDSTVFFFQ